MDQTPNQSTNPERLGHPVFGFIGRKSKAPYLRPFFQIILNGWEISIKGVFCASRFCCSATWAADAAQAASRSLRPLRRRNSCRSASVTMVARRPWAGHGPRHKENRDWNPQMNAGKKPWWCHLLSCWSGKETVAQMWYSMTMTRWACSRSSSSFFLLYFKWLTRRCLKHQEVSEQKSRSQNAACDFHTFHCFKPSRCDPIFSSFSFSLFKNAKNLIFILRTITFSKVAGWTCAFGACLGASAAPSLRRVSPLDLGVVKPCNTSEVTSESQALRLQTRMWGSMFSILQTRSHRFFTLSRKWVKGFICPDQHEGYHKRSCPMVCLGMPYIGKITWSDEP